MNPDEPDSTTKPGQTNEQSRGYLDGEGRIKYIPYDNPPKPLSDIEPVYPQSALDEQIEGTVIIDFFVDEKGVITEIRIHEGIPNSELNTAAIEAIKKVSFKPAEQAGEPVGAWVRQALYFQLDY